MGNNGLSISINLSTLLVCTILYIFPSNAGWYGNMPVYIGILTSLPSCTTTVSELPAYFRLLSDMVRSVLFWVMSNADQGYKAI